MSRKLPRKERPAGAPIPLAAVAPSDPSIVPVARWTVIAAMGLFTLVVFVYRGVWNNAFYQDDYLWLDIARSIADSPAAFFVADPDNSEALVRATQRLVMGLVYAGFGMNAAAHHLANLSLHAVASTLVFRLLLELHLRWGHPTRAMALGVAAGGAVVFATSHHHAMAVLWVSAQSGLLATIAVSVLALYLVRNRDRAGEPHTRGIAAFLFLLALYSKNTAVGFAVVAMGCFAFAPRHAAEPRTRRAGLELATLLLGLGIAHLVFTKWLVVQWAGGGLGGNLAVSPHTPLNVFGAMLAPFVSTGDFVQWTGASVPYPLLSAAWVGVSLLLARWWGVLRPVLAGWLWIVALTVPICFMDFEIYDVVQFTVNRYFYDAMIGAVIVLSFLVRGMLSRLPQPRAGWVLLLCLLTLHVGHHQRWVQYRSQQFRDMGASDQRLMEATLRRAQQNVPIGTTIYAVGWPMEEAFLRRFGRLCLEDAGYGLEGESALREAARVMRESEGAEPWVAHVEEAKQRFGVVRYSVYERAVRDTNR